MLYDDDSHYIWNITSSSTNEMVITVVDLDTEEQRDWLEIVSHSSTSGSELLLFKSGNLLDGNEQITVQNSDYVSIEFISDYSRTGRGFHIIVEPDGEQKAFKFFAKFPFPKYSYRNGSAFDYWSSNKTKELY